MTGRVVTQAEQSHHCAPGWTYRTPSPAEAVFHPGWDWDTQIAVPPNPSDYPPGTVWECDCGTTHVSLGASEPGQPGVCYWRREGRWKRRRRLRRQP